MMRINLTDDQAIIFHPDYGKEFAAARERLVQSLGEHGQEQSAPFGFGRGATRGHGWRRPGSAPADEGGKD